LTTKIDDLTGLGEHLKQIDNSMLEDSVRVIRKKARKRSDLTEDSLVFYDNHRNEYELRGVLHDRENYPLTYHYVIETGGYHYEFDIRGLWKTAGVHESSDWSRKHLNERLRGNYLKFVCNEIWMHFDALKEMMAI
jgi:hypothetical protein